MLASDLFEPLRRHPVAYARVRAALSRYPLPPGDYTALDELERADRDALRKRAEVLGPIFKGIAWDEFYVSHHAECAFADPHRFDPERFLTARPGNDRFAPFGVDHHQCPMGRAVVKMGVIFVRALARDYRVTALTEGPPVRGGYHWEPTPRFAVELRPL